MNIHQVPAHSTSLSRDAATLALGSLVLTLIAGCWRAARRLRHVPADRLALRRGATPPKHLDFERVHVEDPLHRPGRLGA